MLDLAKNPRPSKTAPANHYRVHPVSVKTLLCPLGSSDIAIAYDRDLHPRILLNLSDERPIGLTGVHLRTRTPVNGQCLNTTILKLLSQFHDYLTLIIPAQTRLYGYWNLDRINHRTGYLQHFRDILQHASASALAGNLFDRAAKVKVQYIGPCSLYHLCGTHHSLGVLAVNLDGHGTFLITDGQFLHGLVHLTYQGIARHELGIDHISPEPLAEQTERRVGYILHRSQKNRPLPKINLSNLH